MRVLHSDGDGDSWCGEGGSFKKEAVVYKIQQSVSHMVLVNCYVVIERPNRFKKKTKYYHIINSAAIADGFIKGMTPLECQKLGHMSESTLLPQEVLTIQGKGSSNIKTV